MPHDPILVIGATGKTGRRIVSKLRAAGHDARPGARRAAIPFDWEDERSWAPALDGVAAAYVSYFPDLAAPGAPERIARFAEVAKAVAAPRLVLLSGRGETYAERCEEIVRASGLRHTLVRAAWFAQNFSEGYLRAPVFDGVLALPAGAVREPIVDVEDIADVAVAALTDARHDGRLYDVTGPELLDFHEIAAALASASGRPVRYQPVSLEDFHAAMVDVAGREIADVIAHVCREALDGRNAALGDGVAQALGRAPTRFADFCAAAARDGAWSRAA